MPTREGTVTLVLAGTIFLLATNLMSGLLFALDAVLVSLMLVGIATAYAPIHGIRVSRRLPAHGTEGRVLPIEVTLQAGRGGRFITIEEGWRGTRARGVLPQIAPGVPVTVTLNLTPQRRGQHALEPTEIASRGTVSLFMARRRLAARERVTIWPQTHPVPPEVLADLLPTGEGSSPGERTRHPEDFHGVRDYQRGDSLARIHWRSSVRRGALVVREYERPRARSIMIVIDLDRGQSPHRLDALVRVAASILQAALDRQADVVTAGWNGGYVERRGWEATMGWLAGVVPSGPPLGEALGAMPAGSDHRLIIVAASAALPPLPDGATVIVPANEGLRRGGLVYTSDGVVQAW